MSNIFRDPIATLPVDKKPAPKAKMQPVGPEPQKPSAPVPVLQQHGFHGSIHDFNERVQSVHDSYTHAYGVPPSPGLVFDLAKSPVDQRQFADLFTVPRNRIAAASRGVAGQQPQTPVGLTGNQILGGLLTAARQGQYDAYLRQHGDDIHDLMKDPATAAKASAALLKARRFDTIRDIEARVNAGDLTPVAGHAEIQAAGFIPGGSAFKEAKGVGGFIATTVGQIADSLVHAPGGLAAAGLAVGRDVDAARQGDLSFKRTRAVGEATGKGFYQDFRHPLQNPGYLFLDALGLFSGGTSTAVRGIAAKAALAEGAGLRGAARAALTKPNVGTFHVEKNGPGEDQVLIDNPLVAKAQKILLAKRQANVDARLADGAPAGLRSVVMPQIAQDVVDKNFAFETKIGRLADARRRVEHTAETTLARELDHVAGRSIMQARVFSRMPEKIRGSLTRGEQKAIQALSWDDPNPVQAEIEFHRRMIAWGVGDKGAHARQIADLKLAEKALENPTPRLRKAIALTRQVIAENERLRIEELGLAPETAEGRVAKAAQVIRGENVTGGPTTTGDSFYIPTQPRGKIKRPPSDRHGYFAPGVGPYGMSPGRDLPELTHEFTGDALRAGDIRIDATSLASEAYARTVRAATVRNDHRRLWDAATRTKQGEFDIPIRDVNEIPDRLRPIIAKLDEGDFTSADADLLPHDMRAMLDELYPDAKKLTDEEIPHVRWIDSRLLGEAADRPHTPGLSAEVAQAIQAPFRTFALYLRPAYILNKLANAGMLVLDQGFLNSGHNMARAMSLVRLYGETNALTIRELMGAGKSRSYVASSSGKVSRSLAEFWNRVADRDERVAAFTYYADRKGYASRAQMDKLLNDKTLRADLVEITQRANKSMVQFDNLTPIEKNYLRHIIFVYPWVSRSAVWTLRTIMEHPAKTAILAELGKQEIENDPILSAAPEWFRRTGYFPVGWGADGNPKIVNPTSVNTFSTLGDFVSQAKAQTVGDRYTSLSDMLGPAGKFAIHWQTGQDDYGNKYGGSQFWNAAKDVLAGLPQVSAYEKAHKKNPPLKPSDVTSRAALVARTNSALKRAVMSPGWLDGFGSMIAGGLSPRTLDMDAETARYWRDKNPDVRHRRELDLLNRALTVQGDVLKQPVPSPVRSAVRLQSDISYQYKKFQKDTGRDPTAKERAQFALDYLHREGRIPDAKHAELSKQLAGLVDGSDISTLNNQVLATYANGKALRQWDSDVRAVASFSKPSFDRKAAILFNQGLVTQKRFHASQDQLYEYGRRYVQFEHGVRRLQDEIKRGEATPQDMRVFEDNNDKPVNGLPSFVRIAWAHLPADQQQKAVRANAVGSWHSLTAFEKELLGRKTDPRVTAGWAKLNDVIGEQRAELARQGRSFPSGYKRTLARYVEKNFDAPGLVADFDFANQPLFERLRRVKPIQDSVHRQQWEQVFTVAAGYEKYLKSRDYNKTQVRAMWHDYVAGSLEPWLAHNPAFRAEVDAYGRGVLQRLVS